MLRANEFIKEFNNHNMNLKLTMDQIENIRHVKFSDIETIFYMLSDFDCTFIGEEFCLSNYDMGALIYNYYSDKVYIISFIDIETILKAGKTLKLYARTPDECDRELIEREGY